MSQKIPSGIDWKREKCVFEHDGFVFKRGGSHWVGEKLGVLRPVIIPEYESIGPDITHRNMRTAGMSRARFLELLAKC